jgi:hypothetical protein
MACPLPVIATDPGARTGFLIEETVIARRLSGAVAIPPIIGCYEIATQLEDLLKLGQYLGMSNTQEELTGNNGKPLSKNVEIQWAKPEEIQQ